MNIPKRSENIYPTTEENIKYALLYYFPTIPHSTIDQESKRIYEKRGLALNQVEYVAKLVSENMEFLKGYLGGKANSFEILFQQGTEAIYDFPGVGNEKDKQNYQNFRKHLKNKYQ